MFTNGKIIGDNVSYEQYKAQPIDPNSYNASPVGRGHKDYIVSRSDLMEVQSCPHRWVMSAPEDDEETKSTVWGSLVDCLLLQPEQFSKLYAVAPIEYPDKKTKEMKPWDFRATYCKEWRIAQGSKTCIKTEQARKASHAVTLIQKDPLLGPLVEASRRQVFCIANWEDETGIVVKVRVLLDMVPPLPDKSIIDLKTCLDASSHKWDRAVVNFRYAVQAALHLDVWNCATGEKRKEAKHIVQESAHPYEVVPCEITPEVLALGRDQYQNALRTYCRSIESGHWKTLNEMEGDTVVIKGWRQVQLKEWMVRYDNYERELPRTSEEAIDRSGFPR